MADNRPPLPSASSYDRNAPYADPFADRPRQTQFNEPEPPYHSSTSLPRPYQSSASLPLSAQDTYDDDEYIEKQPLTVGQDFSGGFYPPAYVSFT